jgi:hypothetical protein
VTPSRNRNRLLNSDGAATNPFSATAALCFTGLSFPLLKSMLRMTGGRQGEDGRRRPRDGDFWGNQYGEEYLHGERYM